MADVSGFLSPLQALAQGAAGGYQQQSALNYQRAQQQIAQQIAAAKQASLESYQQGRLDEANEQHFGKTLPDGTFVAGTNQTAASREGAYAVGQMSLEDYRRQSIINAITKGISGGTTTPQGYDVAAGIYGRDAQGIGYTGQSAAPLPAIASPSFLSGTTPTITPPAQAAPVLPASAPDTTTPGAIDTGTTRITGSPQLPSYLSPVALAGLGKTNAQTQSIQAGTTYTNDKDTGQGYKNETLYQQSKVAAPLAQSQIALNTGRAQLDRANAAHIAMMTPVQIAHERNVDMATAERIKVEAQHYARADAVAAQNAGTNAGRLGVEQGQLGLGEKRLGFDQYKFANPQPKTGKAPFSVTSPEYGALAKEKQNNLSQIGQIKAALGDTTKTLTPETVAAYNNEIQSRAQRNDQIDATLSTAVQIPPPASAPNVAPTGYNDNNYSPGQLKAISGSIGKKGDGYGGDNGCATTVCTIMKQMGLPVPQTSNAADMERGLPKFGWTQIPLSQAQKGDIVSMTGTGVSKRHVGVYNGNGQMVNDPGKSSHHAVAQTPVPKDDPTLKVWRHTPITGPVHHSNFQPRGNGGAFKPGSPKMPKAVPFLYKGKTLTYTVRP